MWLCERQVKYIIGGRDKKQQVFFPLFLVDRKPYFFSAKPQRNCYHRWQPISRLVVLCQRGWLADSNTSLQVNRLVSLPTSQHCALSQHFSLRHHRKVTWSKWERERNCNGKGIETMGKDKMSKKWMARVPNKDCSRKEREGKRNEWEGIIWRKRRNKNYGNREGGEDEQEEMEQLM